VPELLERLDAYFKDERVREAAAVPLALEHSEDWSCDMTC
jgi:hypothetical protein